VEALRDRFHLPGMKILQFAFDSDARNPYLPHNCVPNSVIYTGTHDNDTTLGWFEHSGTALRQRLGDYLGCPVNDMPWPLNRAALASVARLAVLPMQDILGLGKGHRMNTPGTTEGNWQWRFEWSQLEDATRERFRHLVHLYGRQPEETGTRD
jgi:4-alpha-glucanotransferase